jgi:C1A family cysteine protease
MADVHRRHLPESVVPGKRLGRSVHHDPRSRAYAVTPASGLVSVRHTRHVAVYDQGDVGDCTAEAALGALSSSPFTHRFRSQRTCRAYYHAETLIDGFGDPYPPNDRGSSSLAAMKVAKAKGWITEYRWAFSLDDVLHALQVGPCIAGTEWLTGMDSPDSSGRVHVTGDVRGGHEYCLVGVDMAEQTILAVNSWSAGWGNAGYFVLTWDDLAQLLAREGDVAAPVA